MTASDVEVDAAEDGSPAAAREWGGLILLALPCLLVSFGSQALNLAIPKLTVALHPSATELLWIVDSYVFFGAGSLITMGVLGDRVGRRRMLFGGGIVFALASLGAAYSPSPGALIAARMVMGMRRSRSCPGSAPPSSPWSRWSPSAWCATPGLVYQASWRRDDHRVRPRSDCDADRAGSGGASLLRRPARDDRAA